MRKSFFSIKSLCFHGALSASLMSVFILSGCQLPAQQPENDTAKPAAAATIVVPVEVEHPERGDISAFLKTFSRVEAEKRVEVLSQAVGRCTSLLVEENDYVSQGQVLAELDKAEAEAQVRQNEIQMRQREVDYARAKQLFEQGFSPRVEFENARFAYEQAQATVDQSRFQLAHHTLRAPIEGLIIKRNVQVGDLVSSGVSLFTIIQPDSFMLVIRPAERDLPRLEPGQAASVELDAVPGKVFKAQVRKISPTVDPDGSIKVTLDFEADAKPFLRNDAYARVLLVMDTHENALLVPKDALVNESGRQFLYIIDTAPPEDEAPAEDADPQYIAKRVEVVTGLDSDDKVEVASGIDDDDLIVTMGQHTETLKPGSRVRLTNLERELEARNGLNPKDALAAARAKRDIENQPAAASE